MKLRAVHLALVVTFLGIIYPILNINALTSGLIPPVQASDPEWTTPQAIATTKYLSIRRSASIAVDTQGNWYVIHENNDGSGVTKIEYRNSNLETSIIATASSPNYVDNPSIALDGNGGVHVVYSRKTGQGDSIVNQIMYRKNISDTWSTPQAIAYTQVGNQASIAVDAQGSWHVAYLDVEGAPGSEVKKIEYINSNSETSTIASATGSNYVDNASIALDGNGGVHVVYSRKIGQGDNIVNQIMYRKNISDTWSTPQAIVNTQSGANLSSIAVDVQGDWHVVYADIEGAPGSEVKKIKYINSNSETSSIASATGSNHVTDPSIDIDNNGKLHVIYWRRSGQITNLMYRNTVPSCGDIELAEQFAPVIYLHQQENYRPIGIDEPLKYAKLVEYDPETSEQKILREAPLTPGDLAISSWNKGTTYIDFKGNGRSGTLLEYRNLIENQASPLAYVRLYCSDSAVATTVIQYWFFYYDNYWLNHHEGDWEMVQVMLDSQSQPIYAAFSQHFAGSKRLWEDIEKEGDHPIVYIAKGSHASYFKPYDTYYLGLENVKPSTRLSINPVPIKIIENSWVYFLGKWGDKANNSSLPLKPDDGPPGPPYRFAEHIGHISLWDDPIHWFKELIWDEDSLANKLGKVNVSVSFPLSVNLATSSTLSNVLRRQDVSNIPSAEYFDNPETERRTLIIHEPDPQTFYEIILQTDPNSQLPSESMNVTIHFPNLESSTIITAHYQLPTSWVISSTATIPLSYDSDFEMELDIDGDSVADQKLAPVTFEETPFNFGKVHNGYLPIMIK